MKWDPIKLVNQGFELKTTADSTLPARWLRASGTTAAMAYLDSTNKKDGNYGATISSDLTSYRGLYQTWSELKPSTTYVLSFDCSTDGGAAGGRIFVYDQNTNTPISTVFDFSNTTWQSNTITFTTPSVVTHTYNVYLENHVYTASGKAYFDNIKIKQSGDAW